MISDKNQGRIEELKALIKEQESKTKQPKFKRGQKVWYEDPKGLQSGYWFIYHVYKDVIALVDEGCYMEVPHNEVKKEK